MTLMPTLKRQADLLRANQGYMIQLCLKDKTPRRFVYYYLMLMCVLPACNCFTVWMVPIETREGHEDSLEMEL